MAINPAELRNKTSLTVSTAIIIFVLGIVFNGGMEYDRITHVETHQALQDIQIASLQQEMQNQIQPINQQLARQSQMLSDIKEELTNRK